MQHSCMLHGLFPALAVGIGGVLAGAYIQTSANMAWGCTGRSNAELVQRLRCK